MPFECTLTRRGPPGFHASVAQLVEQLICNQQVAGSSPAAGPSGPAPPLNIDGQMSFAQSFVLLRRAPLARPLTYNAIRFEEDTGARPVVSGATIVGRRGRKGACACTGPPVGGSHSDSASPALKLHWDLNSSGGCRARRGRSRGEFPSGQRGQTVNLMAQPSQVRILLPPPSPSMVSPNSRAEP